LKFHDIYAIYAPGVLAVTQNSLSNSIHLKYCYFPALESIDQGSFRNSFQLEKFIAPKVIHIGSYAFEYSAIRELKF
jgi:hypothetical protein